MGCTPTVDRAEGPLFNACHHAVPFSVQEEVRVSSENSPDHPASQDSTQSVDAPKEELQPHPEIPDRLASFFDTGMPVWRYVLQMVVMSFIPTMVLANVLAGVGVVTEENVPKFPGPPITMFFGIVIVSPLVETLMMAGIFWLLSFLTRNLLHLAIASSIIWGLLHATTTPVWGVVILWAFFVFSCAFPAWRRNSWLKAVGITSAIHALHNLLPAIAVLVAGAPGRRIEAEPAKPNINVIQPGAMSIPATFRGCATSSVVIRQGAADLDPRCYTVSPITPIECSPGLEDSRRCHAGTSHSDGRFTQSAGPCSWPR